MQSASGPKGPPSGVEPPLGWNLAQREKTGFPRIKYENEGQAIVIKYSFVLFLIDSSFNFSVTSLKS